MRGHRLVSLHLQLSRWSPGALTGESCMNHVILDPCTWRCDRQVFKERSSQCCDSRLPGLVEACADRAHKQWLRVAAFEGAVMPECLPSRAVAHKSHDEGAPSKQMGVEGREEGADM